MAATCKFSFKTEKTTGRYRSFYSDLIYIKIKGRQCGRIDSKSPYKIGLMIEKKDINEDGNPNCEWKWIRLKKEFNTLQEAKDFLNNNIDTILNKYKLHSLD